MGIQPTIELANLGMADSLILMVLALVVFGPRRLPQIGRQIGKLMYEFRKASNDFKFQMEEELRNAEDADRRKKEDERILALAAAPPPPVTETTPPPAQTPVESPYPSESIYPSIAAPQAQADDSPHGEDVPRIQPPSTGEQVPALRPTSAIAQLDAQAAETAQRSTGVEASLDSGVRTTSVHDPDPYEAIEADPPTPAPEPVDHHG